MKKNDVVLLTSALLFSGLFYKQSPGLNFLLLTLLVSTAILILNPEKTKDKNWWYYCICNNLAGAAVFVINSDLSLFACIISLVVLSSKSINRENSMFTCLLLGAYSIFLSFVHWIIELTKKEQAAGNKKQNNWKWMGSIVLILLVVLVFFYLYRQSNPLFDNFTQIIVVDWFNVGWLCFTLFGFFFMYGLLRSKTISLILDLEAAAKKDIQEAGIVAENNHQHTATMAFILFLMLNVMLLFVNGLDISNIYIAKALPQGITLSDFVHQAVWSTVFSILLAVSLIAWFFKGQLNFDPAGKRIRFLVYLWIAQSGLVVINTMVRNYWYVRELQLTHLRIGVFIFLVLCLFGLLLTWFKISNRKSAWRLATVNFEVWFALLVVASLVNWDKAITRFNIANAGKTKALDQAYLIQLSNANLPELVALHNSSSTNIQQKNKIRRKVLNAYYSDRFTQWQSFNLRMQQNRTALTQLRLKF